MSYYFSRTFGGTFDEILGATVAALKNNGFGIITEIDVTETLKKKIGVDFRKYRILGACNPGYAHQALGIEDKIGTMLPCNVIVQDLGGGKVEVAAIDPVASMAAVDNLKLKALAAQVGDLLRRSLTSIQKLPATADR